jgi:hypothetical protein
MILRYLLLVVKDIPCIIVLTLMLITGWRIPTLIDIIKEVPYLYLHEAENPSFNEEMMSTRCY